MCKIKRWHERRNNLACSRLDSVSKEETVTHIARVAMVESRRNVRDEDDFFLFERTVVGPVSFCVGHMMQVEML